MSCRAPGNSRAMPNMAPEGGGPLQATAKSGPALVPVLGRPTLHPGRPRRDACHLRGLRSALPVTRQAESSPTCPKPPPPDCRLHWAACPHPGLAAGGASVVRMRPRCAEAGMGRGRRKGAFGEEGQKFRADLKHRAGWPGFGSPSSRPPHRAGTWGWSPGPQICFLMGRGSWANVTMDPSTYCPSSHCQPLVSPE